MKMALFDVQYVVINLIFLFLLPFFWLSFPFCEFLFVVQFLVEIFVPFSKEKIGEREGKKKKGKSLGFVVAKSSVFFLCIFRILPLKKEAKYIVNLVPLIHSEEEDRPRVCQPK